MPGPTPQFYRLRIRNAANTADVLTITSVRGGANPYLAGPPRGDGASYNPLTGASMLGSYTLQILDWPIGGNQRIVTAQLEDASFRQQLAYRACIIDMSTDGVNWPTVLIAGVLSLLRLVDAMTYEITIQDPMRAMEQSTLFAPSSTLPLATWFAQWPYRGCLAGGPLMTPAGSNGLGPIGIRDLGGWEMRVEGLRSIGSASFYVLRPRVVYGPPKWIANDKSNLDDIAPDINAAAANYQTVSINGENSPWTTINDAMTNGYCWTGITWLIDGVPWKPYPFEQFVVYDQDLQPHFNQSLVSNFSGNWGIAVMTDGVKTLTPGTLVKVRALTVLPTDQCPLYLSGHPCALLATLWGEIPHLTWDQGALDTIRDTVLGADMVMTFRITGAMKLPDLVNQIIQPLGLGLRGDDQGRLQLFDGRIGALNTLPSVQIDASDVIDGSTSLPFELDPSLAAKTITFTQTRFTDQRNAPFSTDEGIVDGVVVGTDTLTMTNGDASALPYGSLDWKTEGMISSVRGDIVNWQKYVTTHARRIFDRFGRGGIGFETTLLRGGAGDTLNLGDEALINLPQVPNHNYRLGDNPAVAARRMQITQRTVLPEGYAVRFDDSGPNAQPLPLVPVLTIAASSDAPRTTANLTITNSAAINAAGYGVRVQWTVTGGGAPIAGSYTDVVAFDPGFVPAIVRLPPAVSGTTVFARARCELASALPSNWSTPVSLVLATINPPNSLTVTPNALDGSMEFLGWTPGIGTTADLTDIWLRTSAQAFAVATRIQVLNPGSTQYVIEGLTPGAGYIASVQHRDPQSGDVSPAVDIAFVAGSTQRQLAAPVNPAGFSGSVNPETGVPNRDGVYGIAVLAAEVPGFLEVQVAQEAGINTGVYGAFATQARAPAIASVQGNWTKAMFVAPNDGLRRRLQARHVLDGCLPSAFCPFVTVLPWTPLSLGPLPTNIILEVTALPASPITEAGVNFRFQLNAIDPYGQTCQVAVQTLTGTGVGIVSGPALTVLSPNATIWKVSLPTPGTGPGSMKVRGQSIDGRQSDMTILLPEQTTLGIPQGTVAVDANGVWEATADGPPNTQSFRWLSSTSGFPSDVTAAGGTLTSGRTFSASGGPLQFGQTVFITAVPFLNAAGNGASLPSIHIRGAFLLTTKAKYDTYPGSGLIVAPPFTATVQQNANTGKLIGSPSINPTRAQASGGVKISNGVIITSVSMYCLFNFTSGSLERLLVSIYAITVSTNSLTPIAQPETDSPSSAAQLVTVTGLNHAVDTNANVYQCSCLMADNGGTATAIDLWNFTIGYTQGNQNAGT